jgi:hypothetical protein
VFRGVLFLSYKYPNNKSSIRNNFGVVFIALETQIGGENLTAVKL